MKAPGSLGRNLKTANDASGNEPTLADIELSRRQKSTTQSAWQRFRRHRLAFTGFIILLTLTILAIGGPLVTPSTPYSIDLTSANQGPSFSYWLGTDRAGRDVLTRLLHGGRVSLTVGVTVVAISLIVGITIGSFSGFFGGRVDSVLMRFVDVVLVFPPVLIVITMVALLGASLFNLILVMGLFSWPPIARLLRAEFLSLRERDFTLAARSIGASDVRIVLRYLIPNSLAPVIVAATFGVASAILLEAGLSFLGLGVRPPTPSWGNMLTDARSISVLDTMPWMWIPPGIMIALAVLAINFIGDGLRDALDPHQSQR